MGTRFRPYHPEQNYLLPPSPADWLPPGHLAYFVSDTVESLDLSVFYQPYEGDGRRNSPYDPVMLLKVLIYAYASGVFSSRKIARKLEEDIAFRVLGAGNFPDHRTINRFRQQHLSDFEQIFLGVVLLARELQLLKLGTLVIDGTKVRANASKHKAMSYGRMQQEEARLKQEIHDLVERATRADEAEDAEHGADRRGDELPEELQFRQQRLQQIEQAKRRLEERQKLEDHEAGRHKDDNNDASGPRPQGGRSKYRRAFGAVPAKRQENFTDPESRIMKTTDGFQQCYNAQVAVDGDSRLIVANEVGQCAADNGYLVQMTAAGRRNRGKKPQRVLADAGYRSEQEFQQLAEQGIRAYVSLGREGKAEPARWSKSAQPATQAMRRRLARRTGQNWYRKRKAMVEPVFGWIKAALGFRGFSLRGVKRVRGEWQLLCAALNLKRIWALAGA
jgi:transposase